MTDLEMVSATHSITYDHETATYCVIGVDGFGLRVRSTMRIGTVMELLEHLRAGQLREGIESVAGIFCPEAT